MTTRLASIAGVLALALTPAPAWAGMPMFHLTDIASMRLQAISFFLVLLLGVTVVIQKCWNLYQRDQTWLPRLSFRGALGFVVVWGLLFQLVLSMIAGARELMTPGAWVRVGTTYKLKDTPERSAEARLQTARRRDLEALRTALWKYAESHDGQLPPHDFVPELPEAVWMTLDASGARFVYLGGRLDEDRIVAYEPPVFGRTRLALYANGTIRAVDARELPRTRTAAGW